MKRRHLIAYTAVACVLALTVAPASAQTVWEGDESDNWFTPGNWDTNLIPTNTDNAFVNNGVTAQVNALGAVAQNLSIGTNFGAGIVNGTVADTPGTGSLVVDVAIVGAADGSGNTTGLLEIGSLEVGSSLVVGRTGFSGNAMGTVTAASVNSTAPVSVTIGFSGSGGDAVGSVVDTSGTGSLESTFAQIGVTFSAGNATGLLEIGSLDTSSGTLRIGVSESVEGGISNGTVDVFGTVLADEVQVGVSNGMGAATGELTAGGLLTVFTGQDMLVGVVSTDAGGDATGTVTAQDGAMVTTSLIIGTSNGAGNADGTVVDTLGTGTWSSFQTNVGVARDSGTATGLLDVGSLELNSSLFVGIAAGGGDGTGTVTAASVNSSGGQLIPMSIGVSFGVGNADGSLVDTLGAGSLTAAGPQIGVVQSSGNATGLLQVGILDASDPDNIGTMNIGVVDVDASGTADGTVEALGIVSGRVVQLGVSELGATGAATGRLILHDDMVATSMTVGRNLSGTGGEAIGEITLDNAILTVGNLILGEGSDTLFHIDGLLRGDEYGAIDAGIATLFDQPGESLGQAMFNFVPTLGTHHFDLITTPFMLGLGGIFGTFSDFDVLGLDPQFRWFTEHVFENQNEIFRLTISSVPEPITAMLGLMGLGVLGMATRRRAA